MYRVAGTAAAQGETLSWSLVLKVLRPAGGDTEPSSPTYWKREVLAYQSGLLAALPGGVAAPRCFGVRETADASAWLWLEDVADTGDARWPLSCYRTAAYLLGKFNGASFTDTALLAAPWLSRGWLADWAAHFLVEPAALTRVLDHQLVRRVCPRPIAARLLPLMTDYATFLAVLDRLPQTFCHHDAWRRNLFLRQDHAGHAQAVLIDWADAGRGALGQELAAFIWAPVLSGELDAVALRDLEVSRVVPLPGRSAGRWVDWRSGHCATRLHSGYGRTQPARCVGLCDDFSR